MCSEDEQSLFILYQSYGPGPDWKYLNTTPVLLQEHRNDLLHRLDKSDVMVCLLLGQDMVKM